MTIGPESFTKKTGEALAAAQRKALDNSNISVEPVHILSALLEDGTGLAVQIL
ncbi:MAG: hypothetical protein J6X47_06600, partial [Clostridia bacterium]|nr:hypothetical protein [Clostridia bacterium]